MKNNNALFAFIALISFATLFVTGIAVGWFLPQQSSWPPPCTITFSYENSSKGSFVRLAEEQCDMMRERCEEIKGCKYCPIEAWQTSSGVAYDDFRINYEGRQC